jgi:structural maintenance of chromosome 2
VTLEGDVFDPSGTLSGGASEKQKVLDVLAEYRGLMRQLEQKEAQLAQLDAQGYDPGTADRYRKLREQFELKTHEMNNMEQRLAQTDHRKVMAEADELRASLEEQQRIIDGCKDKQKEWMDKVKDLEYKTKNIDKLRDLAIQEAKRELDKCEKSAAASANKAKDMEQEAQEYGAEVDAAQSEIADLQAKIQVQ